MKTQRCAQSPKRARSTKKRQPVRAWVLRDPDVLSVVFQTFEDLTALRQQCARKVASARDAEQLFGRVFFEPDQSGLQRWSRIYERIKDSWDVFDDLVRTHQFDAARCQAVYRDLMGLQVAWQRMKGPLDCLELMDQMTKRVRQVLIHHAQWQGHRGSVSS